MSHFTGHSKFAQRTLERQKQPAAPTLFMGNLPFEIDEEDIRSMLTAHRKLNCGSNGIKEEKIDLLCSWLKKIRLGTFEDSGKCKGSV